MESFNLFSRPSMRTAGLALALASTSLLSGCQDLVDQLQSNYMAVAVLTQTPTFDDPTNPGHPLPEAAAFTLTFAKVDKTQMSGASTSSSAVDPVKDAEVKLAFKDTDTNEEVVLNLSSDSAGTYTATSKDSKLKVRPTLYTLDIKYAGKTYRMTVSPPTPVKIKEFETSKLVADHTAGTDFTVTRAPVSDDVAIVNVTTKSGDGVTSAYSNLPKDPLGLVKFALVDDEWRKPSFTIPGTTFQAQSQFVVSMSTMAKGKQSTDLDTSALFSASSFLAGTSDAGVIATK
jgi:hypothetical protein